MATPAEPWAIVVPVKRLALAKTRLRPPDEVRADLALAMALDTVRAALGCPGVVMVVTVSDDERAAPLLEDLGAVIVPDAPDAGLNPALSHGVRAAAALVGGAAVAALSSDLPALRPAELAAVLVAAEAHAEAMVADAHGAGTTLLCARPAGRFRPAFGPQSRSAHLRMGAVDLSDVAGASVRRDVDTTDDLRAALELGCGPATTELLARHPHLCG